VPIQAGKVGIFFVKIHNKNNIIIGLVDERVATMPASAFCKAINNKLIPKAIPRKPLKIDCITIFKFKLLFALKISKFTRKVKDNRRHDVVVLIAADAIGSAPRFKIGFIITTPIAWHSAAQIDKKIPIDNDPSTLSHRWFTLFLSPYAIAITTPKKTIKQPNILIKETISLKKIILIITVKGAAKENNILFLLGPIFCKAINKRVSPIKIPIIPEITMTVKYSGFIVNHVSIKNVYEININETKNNLNLLKAKPPKFLVTSADINEAIAQHRAAAIAIQ